MEVWSLLGGLNWVMREIVNLCANSRIYARYQRVMRDIISLCSLAHILDIIWSFSRRINDLHKERTGHSQFSQNLWKKFF